MPLPIVAGALATTAVVGWASWRAFIGGDEVPTNRDGVAEKISTVTGERAKEVAADALRKPWTVERASGAPIRREVFYFETGAPAWVKWLAVGTAAALAWKYRRALL